MPTIKLESGTGCICSNSCDFGSCSWDVAVFDSSSCKETALASENYLAKLMILDLSP